MLVAFVLALFLFPALGMSISKIGFPRTMGFILSIMFLAISLTNARYVLVDVLQKHSLVGVFTANNLIAIIAPLLIGLAMPVIFIKITQ